MLEFALLHAADARRSRWKNGRGESLELALWPEDASFERGDFDWRISRSRVEASGPFSAYPGFERLLLVTAGEGLVLEHGSAAPRARVRSFEPHRFSGDWPTEAALVGGPIEDFNVFARRGRVRAELLALALGARPARESLAAGAAFVHVLEGELRVRATGADEPYELAAGDSLRILGLRGGEELDLRGSQLRLVLVGLAPEP
jgi:environmental stress-induced protein Ves